MSHNCKCNCATFREHVGNGPYIASSAAPTHRQDANQWDRDTAAYTELKKQGIQPKSTTGAAELAKKATTRLEIERGRLYPNAKRQETFANQVKEATS